MSSMQTPERAPTEIVFPGPAGPSNGPPSGEGPSYAPARRQVDVRQMLAAMWLQSVRSPNTRVAYEQDIGHYFRWLDEWSIDALHALQVHVDAYRNHLLTGDHAGRYLGRRSYAPSTVARKLVAVSSFYRYAVRNSNGAVLSNPCEHVARPEVSNESMTPGLSDDEVAQLLDAATAAGPRLRALVLLLVGTGLRVSEAVKADTGDLTVERGRRVLLVTRKGGKRQRVRLPVEVDRALVEYLRGRQGPLFLDTPGKRRMTRQQADYYLRRLARAAGIETPVSPHVLRHTAATHALNDGAGLRDVQVQLGHARPDTTARYDRARRDLDNAAARSLAALVDAAGERRRAAGLSDPRDKGE
jgi:integrase/recombinase XerD